MDSGCDVYAMSGITRQTRLQPARLLLIALVVRTVIAWRGESADVFVGHLGVGTEPVAQSLTSVGATAPALPAQSVNLFIRGRDGRPIRHPRRWCRRNWDKRWVRQICRKYGYP